MNKKLFALMFLCISGCTIEPDFNNEEKDRAPLYVPVDVMAVPNAIPKYEKRTRAGNPPAYTVLGKHYKVLTDNKGYQQEGIASWYGTKFHGKKTSNGEIYDMYAMTAAHKTLPIPSYVRVTHLKNQRSVVVRINDRGPFHDNRIIDLSYTAAVKLGIQQSGTGFVTVTAIDVLAAEKAQTVGVVAKKLPKGNEVLVYLQVGAFINAENAKQLQHQLASGDIKRSRVQLAQKQHKVIYKVQVGPLFSVQQADQESEKLALLGYTDTHLIIEKK